MSTKDKLNENLKQAMKARDNLRLSVVRMILAAVRNREIERRSELDDQGISELLSTLAKQRRESVRLYRDGNRPDLVAKEEAELAVLEEFLPEQLTAEELSGMIERVIAETGAEGTKDIGRVMKALSPLIAGRADGKSASEMAREKLS